jgi:hypothetical protein
VRSKLFWCLSYSSSSFIYLLLYTVVLDYHGVTRVWVTHWWITPAFLWFRNRYCPPGTADEQCAAPSFLDEAKVTDWCQENYDGATNCYDIQVKAQNAMIRDMTILFSFGFIGGFLISFLVSTAWAILDRSCTDSVASALSCFNAHRYHKRAPLTLYNPRLTSYCSYF